MTTMPKQKPGRSKQDYGTPPEFIEAVEDRFGTITFDLSASKSNAVADRFFDIEADSLVQDWTKLDGVLWLNPPFARIDPWAKKCAASRSPKCDRTILMLTPASVGSNWFASHVHGVASVLALSPRITFVGETAGYPKDLILSVFGGGHAPGFSQWRWS